jgi:hypothetical protein
MEEKRCPVVLDEARYPGWRSLASLESDHRLARMAEL